MYLAVDRLGLIVAGSLIDALRQEGELLVQEDDEVWRGQGSRNLDFVVVDVDVLVVCTRVWSVPWLMVAIVVIIRRAIQPAALVRRRRVLFELRSGLGHALPGIILGSLDRGAMHGVLDGQEPLLDGQIGRQRVLGPARGRVAEAAGLLARRRVRAGAASPLAADFPCLLSRPLAAGRVPPLVVAVVPGARGRRPVAPLGLDAVPDPDLQAAYQAEELTVPGGGGPGLVGEADDLRLLEEEEPGRRPAPGVPGVEFWDRSPVRRGVGVPLQEDLEMGRLSFCQGANYQPFECSQGRVDDFGR